MEENLFKRHLKATTFSGRALASQTADRVRGNQLRNKN
jgi:hypothetical protein